MVGARVIALAAAALLAGCSNSAHTEVVEPWLGPPFEERVERAMAEAAAGGAGDTQIEILERARAEGKVLIEDARAAALATIDCFAANGLDAEYTERQRTGGLLVPSYLVSAPVDSAETTDPMIDACEARESRWVNELYQSQPLARQLLGEYVMSKEATLRSCLEAAGKEPDPLATGWELAMFAIEDQNLLTGGLDCLDAAGIDGL